MQAGAGATEEMDSSASDADVTEDEKKLTIEYFATDLTDEAKSKLLDPVI